MDWRPLFVELVIFFWTVALTIGLGLIEPMGTHPPSGFICMKDYLIAFPENLERLIDLNVKPTELKVILYILKAMSWGNLIAFSQKDACKALNIKKSNMSAIFKSLTKKGVLTIIEGHTYLNANLFAKGLAREMYPETRAHLARAQREVNGIGTAFDAEPSTVAVAGPAGATAQDDKPAAPVQRHAAPRRRNNFARADGSFRMPL